MNQNLISILSGSADFFKKPVVAKIAPIIFLFLIAIAIFSPYLFFGKMSSGEEDIGIYYPAAFFYQNTITEGKSFLWDSFYYGGFPVYLNVLNGFLYPLHYVLFKFLPLFTAYYIAIAFPVFWGMVFSYLFGRVNSFSKIGSLILALSYALSQTLGGLDTILGYSNGFMVLPLLLFCVSKINQAKTIRSSAPPFLIGVLGATVGFLAGFPQTVLYGITFAFAYALFLDLSKKEHYSLFSRFRNSVILAAYVALGAIIASPQLLSTFLYLDVSVRTAHYTADVFSRPPFLSYIVSFFFPDSFVIPFFTSGVAGIYVGVPTLVFAAVAVIFFRTRITWFFLSSLVFISAMAVGLPGIAWINNNLPVFSRISDVGRWFIIGGFILSFLGAFGYERLKNQDLDWFKRRTFRIFLKAFGVVVFWIIFFAATANILLFFVFSNADFKNRLLNALLRDRVLNFPYEHYRYVFDGALQTAGYSLSFWNWEFLLSLLLFPASFFVLKYLNRKSAVFWFSPVVFFLVTANLFISFGAYFKDLIPQSLVLETPLVVRAIKERETNLKSFRFIPFLTGEAVFREISSKIDLSSKERALINREILTNQIGALYGLQNMWGYEPLRTLRSNQLLDTIIAPNLVSIFDIDAAKRGARIDQKVNNEVLRPVSLEEKKRDFLKRLGLISMMNVKYIISLYPLNDSRLIEVKMPQNSDLPLPIHLYENKEVMPRIYFAENPVFWKDDERNLLIEVAENENFRKKTFIECPECEGPKEDISKNKIFINKYENSFSELSVETKKGGWLVFSESNVPGWVAEIDLKRTKIYAANYLFQSVFVPAGEHLVKFEYVGPFKLWLEKFGVRL